MEDSRIDRAAWGLARTLRDQGFSFDDIQDVGGTMQILAARWEQRERDGEPETDPLLGDEQLLVEVTD